MREIKFIKFRAYIIQEKRMSEVKTLSPVSEYILDEKGKEYSYQEIKLMQYTGLKDKNGKEVYDGDIVKCSTKRGECNNIIDFYNHYVRVRRRKYTYPISPYSGLFNRSAEVIGNIYENPELLK